MDRKTKSGFSILHSDIFFNLISAVGAEEDVNTF